MQSIRAATLDLGDDARASHTSAAALWGVPGFRIEPIDLVQEGRADRRSSLVHQLHSVRLLPTSWVTVLDGVPVVRPELMLLQLCGSLPPRRTERALDNAWAMRLVSGRSLVALLASYGEMGRNGSGVLRAFMEERGPDYIPPESNLESRFMTIIERHGLPQMRRQVNSGGETWTGRVDFISEDLPLEVELQSERYP